MLTVHCSGTAEPQVWNQGDALPADAVWLDLLDATDEETQAAAEATGLQLPPREEIRGLGLAGRNRASGETLYLHVARFADVEDESLKATPLSIVLTRRHLVTQRYARSRTFASAAEQWQARQRADGASAAFAELVETMSERTAEAMQKIASSVAELSEDVFADAQGRTRRLRAWLRNIGHLEGRLARSRASLLGITRVVSFMVDRVPQWMPSPQQSRLATVRTDLATLDEFDQQLTDKLQFLLDAVFGFISVEQNSVMKVFTVWALAAVPPVLLAGIWGMNFKHMPELSWTWGYAFALGCMAVSIAVPLAIFKWRGWLSSD